MKWITREPMKVDRVACPWLFWKFVDSEVEFHFVPAEQVGPEAERFGAMPFDVPNFELGHHGKECSFEAILKEYGLIADPAIALLGQIVNGAETDNSLWQQRESDGLNALQKVSGTWDFKMIKESILRSGACMTRFTPIAGRWCAARSHAELSRTRLEALGCQSIRSGRIPFGSSHPQTPRRLSGH